MKLIFSFNRIILFSLILLAFYLLVKAQSQGDPPAVKPGLQMSRVELISKTTEFNNSLVFKQVSDSKGTANFTATNTSGSTVELTDNVGQLVIAKWTLIATDDKKNNETELQRMQWFCMNLGGPNGWEWYAAAIAAINKAIDKPYSSEKLFNYNRQAKFQYIPKEKSYTITFTPW
jgi:hypothetical protein